MLKLFTKTLILNTLFNMTALANTIELSPITVSDTLSIKPSLNTEPTSKDEFYSEELIERNIKNLETLGQQTVNLHLITQGIGSFGQQFSLRGMGNTPLFGVPSVVVYIDDVPYSSSMTTIGRLFNIDNLVIYRNSQPSLFGKNAYAGAIDIKTQQAENRLNAGISLELANFDQKILTANASGALIKDELYFNLAGQYDQRDGFLYNSYLHTTPDDQENFSGRASLKWTPNKSWDIRLLLNKEDLDYGSSRFVRLDSPQFYTVRSGINESLKQQSDSEAIRIAYDNDDYQLLSVSNRQFWQMNPRVVSLSLTPMFSVRKQNFLETNWSQEFRLEPKKLNTNWNWHTGLFYSNNEKHNVTDTNILQNNMRIETKQRLMNNYALFGHLDYQGFNAIKPYLDLRFDYVTTYMNAINTFPDRKIKTLQQHDDTFFVSPKFGLDIKLSKNALVYVGTGLSFKPAGFAIANLNDILTHYKTEQLWHNELGLKTQWFDKSLKLNLAGFYYDIKNYQVERFYTQIDYAVVNAKRAYSYGFELESEAELLNNLTLQTNLGFTHIEFDQYIDPITKISYAGKIAPFVPDFNGLLALQYKDTEGYFARLEGIWTGRTYFNENNTDIMQQKDYVVANMRLGYQQPHYSIYAFANNLTNRNYYTFKIDSTRGVPSDPRMIGVRLAVNF